MKLKALRQFSCKQQKMSACKYVHACFGSSNALIVAQKLVKNSIKTWHESLQVCKNMLNLALSQVLSASQNPVIFTLENGTKSERKSIHILIFIAHSVWTTMRNSYVRPLLNQIHKCSEGLGRNEATTAKKEEEDWRQHC